MLPPLSLLEGRVILRYTGIFLGLYFDFGLLVRYDGNHFVEVKVPAIYAGRLCGLCGEWPGLPNTYWGSPGFSGHPVHRGGLVCKGPC